MGQNIYDDKITDTIVLEENNQRNPQKSKIWRSPEKQTDFAAWRTALNCTSSFGENRAQRKHYGEYFGLSKNHEFL